eukprot:gnl/MRDRNA2_/MRDRNA2_118052_c0_seq1.p1 gnl/MRDRNA2_/MRDRNA2_118052_c0~~gnl/MRDRNA2_/MRDRNA2_118052_c0_seq1.p1  ORF type:complete len:527 (+),score=63.18 gnl/MRDRNA2_/MRDRNA2_118052_c0_seq1:88-1581(+)
MPHHHERLTRTVMSLFDYNAEHSIPSLVDFLDGAMFQPCIALPGAVIPQRAVITGRMHTGVGINPFFEEKVHNVLVPPGKDSERDEPVVLYVSYMRGCLDPNYGVLKKLRQSDGELLRTRWVETFLEHKWHNVARAQFHGELVLHTIFVIVFVIWCTRRPGPSFLCCRQNMAFDICRSILMCFSVYFVWQESKQMLRERRYVEYLKSPWNVLDLLKLGLVVFLMVQSFIDPDVIFESEGRYLTSTTAVVVWTRLLGFGRGFATAGHLIRTLIEILADVRYFSFITMLIIFGFAHAFYLIFDLEGAESGLLKAILLVYGYGVLGEDINDDAVHEDKLAVALWMICTFIILVIMVNFLIAIMADTFDRVLESATIARNQELAEMIYDVETFLPEKRLRSNEYLFACFPEDTLSGEGSEWEGKIRQIKREISKNGVAMEQDVAVQQNRMNIIEGQMQALNTRMLSIEKQVASAQANSQSLLQGLHDSLESLVTRLDGTQS